MGVPFVPVEEPLKPGPEDKVVPAGIVALYEALVTVTELPLWVKVPPQPCVTAWPLGNEKRRLQPFIAVVPVFEIVMLAPKPPCH